MSKDKKFHEGKHVRGRISHKETETATNEQLRIKEREEVRERKHLSTLECSSHQHPSTLFRRREERNLSVQQMPSTNLGSEVHLQSMPVLS